MPVALLGAFEVVLRVAGYGHSTRFLVEKEYGGQTFHVVNKEFYQQFMSMPVGNIMNLDDLGFSVPAKKADDAYRIFILGSSAAHGCTPDFAYGFGRMLELMLRARFPQVRFEVYNAACPALNSHVMRFAAEGCATLEPDLFIVYMGNNEFSGPFGPAWGGEGMSSLTAIRTWMAFGELRTVQWLRNMAWRPWLPRTLEASEYLKGLRRFRHDSPQRANVSERFRQNIEDIRAFGVKAGASVLLCTVGSNIRDWQPFDSMHPAGWPDSSKSQWEAHFRTGRARQEMGAYREAVESYIEAAALDGSYAELQYRIGTCYWRLEAYDKAAEHLRLARDYDALPMRVDGPQNQIIADTAAHEPSDWVGLVDIEGALAEHSAHGIEGGDMFWDFVHFNFTGGYTVARSLFDRIATLLVERTHTTDKPAPLSQSDCERRLGFTPPVLLRHVKDLVPAFRFWGVADEYVSGLIARQAALEKQIGANGPDLEEEGYRQALALSGRDYYAMSRYARLLLQKGDSAAALGLARTIVAQHPLRPASHWLLIDALEKVGKKDEAIKELHALLDIFPDAQDARAKSNAVK